QHSRSFQRPVSAEELGLPFLPASLSNSSHIAQGVNFAVNGATAIDVGFFERNRLVQFKLLNNSLDVQLGWFEKLRPSLCNTNKGSPGCFSRSLFVVGEFGVNDYNFMWTANKSQHEVRSHVPKVVKTIASAVERLIGDGAAHIVVPGNPPTGCLPAILTLRQSPAAADYDRAGCLRGVNDVARHHNALLRAAVGGLRLRHPHARIVFADFYRPVYRILENPGRFGFVVGDVLKACCGAGGGAYNWNGSAVCGMPGVAACGDPAAHVSWDGAHFTEAVSRYVAKGWLHGPYADPPILSAVPR
ncbi:GDSL esterase/lipase At5g45910-like, partial [Panicum virgatum]|uniref:GDSL esterase/lipase At5g45910-like n=1 Tax=Panicum virgatum TaxID=38727 RepID=UPI0019D53FDF